jgi:hypothetical protein
VYPEEPGFNHTFDEKNTFPILKGSAAVSRGGLLEQFPKHFYKRYIPSRIFSQEIILSAEQ